jgi:AraC-like DNA-binding protein
VSRDGAGWESAFTTYRDPDEFTEILNLDVRLTPTARGPFQAEKTVARRFGPVFYNGIAVTPAVSHTVNKSDETGFLFLDECSAPILRNGMNVTADCLLVLPAHTECIGSAQAHGRWWFLRIDDDALHLAMRTRLGVSWVPRHRVQLLRADPRSLTQLRFACARALMEHRTSEAVTRAWEDTIMRALTACLSTRDTSAILNRPVQRLIPRFLETLEKNEVWPLTVAQVCAELGTTDRTLYRHCVDHFGMSPGDYVRCHRLNLARRALLRADPAGTKLQEVALRYGFIEPGWFTAHYHSAFGEAPFDTLRRVDCPKWP